MKPDGGLVRMPDHCIVYKGSRTRCILHFHPPINVALTTMRWIRLGFEARLSGQFYIQFNYLHMHKISTKERNIERQDADEKMIAKEGKMNYVTENYLGVKFTIENCGHNR